MNASGIPEQYARKLTREETNRLPIKRWQGPVRLVHSAKEITEALHTLEQERILGFDTETRPAFRKGVSHQPSLIQLAGAQEVTLFQLHRMEDFTPLIHLFSREEVLKVGVGLDQDIRQLQPLFPFEPKGFVDLGAVAERAGMESRGLRSMAATLFGFRISKRAQCSNWETPDLQPFQVEYAATDAWISREIFLMMEQLGIVDPPTRP
ncbi:MAG: 3'-5' exonuclease domain-containing protein 2 [Magnetococcales bacterium]|nr:3'-5' exonuclease domain-containing protein 2 [Magnetococcales bacterium]MBF0321604.1 3'-5' exonuclease domain-containing protein 2 [Magnetococcales bacterium]